MPGSTSRWGQQEDPRDNTVDLPRIDVDGLTDYFRRAAPMLEPEPAGLLEPLPEHEPAGLLEPLPEQGPAGLLEPLPDPAAADPSSHPPAPAPEVEPTPSSAVAAAPRVIAAGGPESSPPTEPAEPVATIGRPVAERSEQERSARPGPDGRAPAGSLADLRSRLARLPDGHPSSPYDDGGHARPLPIRLKQLELGLPAPGREASGFAPEPPEPITTPAEVERAAESDSEPARTAAASPAPPELADPYAIWGNGQTGGTSAESSPRADLTLGPWQATPPARVSSLEGLSHRGGNGHRPKNGSGNGSRRRDTPEHQTDEPPSADLRELVEQTLTTGRTAEGRNVLGSYGSSGLTPMMQRIAAHLPFGGLAPDSEANSLKSADRLTAKLARLVARNPGRTAEELAATIGDVVRYAFAFEAADYVEGTWLVHRRLKSHGFELEIRRNRWESPEYKGIFTQWRDPAHEIPFEVQFHTTASWAVVQRSHEVYVQITDPATPSAERARLRAGQVAAAAAAKAPPNWSELEDFRLEAR